MSFSLLDVWLFVFLTTFHRNATGGKRKEKEKEKKGYSKFQSPEHKKFFGRWISRWMHGQRSSSFLEALEPSLLSLRAMICHHSHASYPLSPTPMAHTPPSVREILRWDASLNSPTSHSLITMAGAEDIGSWEYKPCGNKTTKFSCMCTTKFSGEYVDFSWLNERIFKKKGILVSSQPAKELKGETSARSRARRVRM